MPNTPNSGYTPPPSRPRPLPVRAAGAQYSVVTHNNKPPNRRTVSDRFWGQRSFRGARAIPFFWHPGRNHLPLRLAPTPRRRLDPPGLERSDEYELPDQQTSQDCPATGRPIAPADPATAAALAAEFRQRFSPWVHPLTQHARPCATFHPCGPICLLPAPGLLYSRALLLAPFCG